jgi:hypothetical protein
MKLFRPFAPPRHRFAHQTSGTKINDYFCSNVAADAITAQNLRFVRDFGDGYFVKI